MEVPYIFAILNTIVAGVYVYAIHAFNYANKGVGYLTNLAYKEPEKLNNDPTTLSVLKTRDLPNTINFSGQRDRVKSLLAVAIIINLINYVMYPYDDLLYPWMSYIIIGAAVVVNLDAILIFFNLRRNKRIVDTICTAYDNLTLAHEENKQMEETVISIEEAFGELMEDLNKAFTEDKNKNGDDEK